LLLLKAVLKGEMWLEVEVVFVAWWGWWRGLPVLAVKLAECLFDIATAAAEESGSG
jgi:hypothetical protein